MSRVIPVTLNKLSMAEAFRFYRDELKLHVYPVDGPWSEKADPGKKPSVKAWWNYDPKECDVEQYFRPQRCHNIGVCPTGKLYIVDLDSKTDQGESVYEFIASKPTLAKIPRHRTRGGCHLVFFCEDVPPIRRPRSNKPYDKALFSPVSDKVGAEFYHNDHQNVVFPPSTHVVGLFKYEWEVMGEIPKVSWKWVVETFGFKLPGEKEEKPKKEHEIPFHENFKGDFKFLDLVKLTEALGLAPELLNAEEGKYAITCPWASEHSETAQRDVSSTVIYQQELGKGRPGFKCLHSHCETRGFLDVIVWAETKKRGIVDEHCSVMRVWSPGQTDPDGKPRILHTQHNELNSVCHTNLGKIMGGVQQWFDWLGQACKLDNIISGRVYVGEEERTQAMGRQDARVAGFKELDGLEASGHCEYFCTPGYLKVDMAGNPVFIKASFGNCIAHLKDPHLLAELPNPHRILTVPFPFLAPDGKSLIYPGPGYDPKFHTYMIDGAPAIDHGMPLSRAKEILTKIHEEFCFENEQSRVHAFARIITPFARGLMDSFSTRVPLWIYKANRPRAGKDYLAIMTILVYEGIGAEDSPITARQSEETMKRLMSAARNGRRFMHFSNCTGLLDDIHLTQAITNERITSRKLGSNEASSDLSVPNTMEFSLSGNMELRYSEDIDERSRPIQLAFFEEAANGRKFKEPFLHRNVRNHRGEILSAIAALFHNWEHQGMPLGRDVFTTYPQWAEIVGGVMAANELGNPCLPFKSEHFGSSGDPRTEAVTALYAVGHNVHGDTWIKKKAIYSTIHEATQNTDDDSGVEALEYFGPLEEHPDARSNQTRLGLILQQYNMRILDDIQLQIDSSSANSGRHLYRFVKIRGDGPDITTPKKPSDNPENTPKTPEKPRTPCQPVNLVDVHNPTCEPVGRNKKVSSNKIKRVGIQGSSAITVDEVDRLTPPAGIALDIETYSSDPKSRDALDGFKGKIRLVSVANSEGIQTFDLKKAPLSRETLEAIRSNDLIIHNASFELRWFGRHFGFIPKNVFCTLTADRLLIPSKKIKHDLKTVLDRRMRVEISKDIDQKAWSAAVLSEAQLAYARIDVEHLHTLRKILDAEIDAADLRRVFNLESDLLPIITKMELHGFAVSTERMEKIRDRENGICAELEREIRAEFHEPELNVNAPAQLLAAFEKAGTKLKSTAEESLTRAKNPLGDKVLAYRKSKKLASSVESLLEDVRNGRLHSEFNPLGAIHGRFSSKGPNLQNVHRGELRECFIPSKIDNVLISADYGQIELRVAALIARDDVMLAALKAGEDLHRKIAAVNLHCTPEEVTKEQRITIGKASNFGFVYGQGAKGFQSYARTTWGAELDLEQATAYRDNYLDLYRGIKRWHNECWNKAKYSDLVEARTTWGRRLLPAVDSEWGRFNMHTEYVVSGSCADLIKLAMLRVSKAKLPLGAEMVATVHDELVFDIPAATAEESKRIIVEEMTAAFVEMFGTEIPVEVEAKVCANWGEK